MAKNAVKPGRLWYVIGPSGAGKDSLLAYARARLPEGKQVFAHRYITRPAEAGGENHVALSENEFLQRERAGCFILAWERNGLHYGIGIEIRMWLDCGLDVVVNGSRAVLPRAQALFPTLIPIWITAPSQVLARRLAQRGRESREEILARLAHVEEFVPPPGARVLENAGELAVAGEQLLAWFRTG